MLHVIEGSVQGVIDHVVDQVPGVLGAIVASADGFVIASRLPPGDAYDASSIAAMSAAALALATRLVQIAGSSPASTSIHRSQESQVCVFAVGTSAALTIIADAGADTQRIDRIGYEVCWGLTRALVTPPSD